MRLLLEEAGPSPRPLEGLVSVGVYTRVYAGMREETQQPQAVSKALRGWSEAQGHGLQDDFEGCGPGASMSAVAGAERGDASSCVEVRVAAACMVYSLIVSRLCRLRFILGGATLGVT